MKSVPRVLAFLCKLNKTSCFLPAVNLWIMQAYLGHWISPELQSCSMKGMAQPWEEHPKHTAHLPAGSSYTFIAPNLILSNKSDSFFMRHSNAAQYSLVFTQPVFLIMNLVSPLRPGCVFCNIKTLQFPWDRMKVEVAGLMTKLLLSGFDNKIALLFFIFPEKYLHIISHLIQF